MLLQLPEVLTVSPISDSGKQAKLCIHCGLGFVCKTYQGSLRRHRRVSCADKLSEAKLISFDISQIILMHESL